VIGWGRAEAEYNLRQVRLAEQAVSHYLASNRRVANLGDLVHTLDGLKAVLELPDEEWQDRLEDPYLTLETEYALHLDRKEKELEPESARRIEDAVGTLQGLVASASETLEQIATDNSYDGSSH
jgi:hypothetical protein